MRFNYGQVHSEARVLEELSLHIRPGEKIGLVGRSGAGKSTLVSLLLRFHDLQQGRVLIDGQDISHRHPGKFTQVHRHGHPGHSFVAQVGF